MEWFQNIDWSWTRAFFAWPEDASIWDVLNSPILVTFLAALIGWQLNKRVQKAEEKAEDAANLVTLKDDVEAAEADEEEEPDTSADQVPASENFRAEAEALFDQGEDFIKERMKNASDGRHRRTYKNIAGASMPIKAAALHERKDLSPLQYQGAIELAHEWNQYRRGKAACKPVPRASLEKMRRSLNKLKSG